MTAVALAGGFGTRIRHVLPDLPKPMAPVCGRPFVEWVVRYLARQGVTRVVISTGYLAEKIEGHFARTGINGVTVRCYPETTPLGTAGGFLNAAGLSGDAPGAWLVLNGDSLILSGFEGMIAALGEGRAAGAIMGRRVEDASRYGTLEFGGDGGLTRFAEKRPGSGVINAGVYLLRGELLERIGGERPLNFEQDVFPDLIKGGANLQVVEAEGEFLDIGTEESLKEAEGFILQNREWFLE